MNSLPARRAAVLVGLGIVGFFAADKVLGSKNNNVTWDINRQLDQMNGVADMGRQASEIERKINASPLKRGSDQGIQGDDPAQ